MTQARVRQSLYRLFVVAFPSLLVAMLFSGCSGSIYLGQKNPPTVTIAASPTTVVSGASSTLTVVATDSTTVTISGSDGSTYTLATTGGTQSVTPATKTTYTVTATGTGGTATATATVNVNVPPAPAVTIVANPASVLLGGASMLTVVASNATAVTIAGSDGSSHTLAVSGGTQSVTPSLTTTYTATATGAPGSVPAQAQATATVTVTAPSPTVTITADPTSITSTQSSVLTVHATNSATVKITGTDGSSYNLTTTGGIQSVSPTATATYTATATGPGGTKTATAKVIVTANPAPTVTIQASPASISAGQSSTLMVTAANTTQGVTVTGSDNSSYTLGQTGGSQVVSPTATTTYTATGTGAGGTTTATATVTITATPQPSVSISASPTTIKLGASSTLTVTASNATAVSISGSDGSSYPLAAVGTPQTQVVTPTGTAPETVTYTATATGAAGTTPAANSVTLTVDPPGSVNDINHVIFMMQENHTFDNYFGMLNPYRKSNTTGGQKWNIGDDGNEYDVDGIDDKLTTIVNNSDNNIPTTAYPNGVPYHLFKLQSTCIDDDSSDWLASFGDINRYYSAADRNTSISPDRIVMDGFVHNARGYDLSCAPPPSNKCGVQNWTDSLGARAMGYYDQDYLNYYYWMASQFALSDRWFSPVASKSISNRIATFSGGTTQGLVKDPGNEDHTAQLNIPTIFRELNSANVSWKIYYSATNGGCLANSDGDECLSGAPDQYPASDFESFTDSYNYVRENSPNPVPCNTLAPNMVSSTNVGDTSGSFCIDPTHMAPINQYFIDLQNNALPSFVFIEAGYGQNDEHPGSGQPVLQGQTQMSSVLNAFMNSSSYADSVFFLSYDEGGGPYDHVPPVPGHSNDKTINDLGYLGNYSNSQIPDIAGISVAPDTYIPNTLSACPYANPTYHCDLTGSEPGTAPGDLVNTDGFAAQIGFRVPNFIVSPFARRHFVSHTPIDHTAIIKFVESRFIGSNAHLTNRDAAQPDLLEFFDFTNIPWATAPTLTNAPPPEPFHDPTKALCTPGMHPMDGVAPQ